MEMTSWFAPQRWPSHTCVGRTLSCFVRTSSPNPSHIAACVSPSSLEVPGKAERRHRGTRRRKPLTQPQSPRVGSLGTIGLISIHLLPNANIDNLENVNKYPTEESAGLRSEPNDTHPFLPPVSFVIPNTSTLSRLHLQAICIPHLLQIVDNNNTNNTNTQEIPARIRFRLRRTYSSQCHTEDTHRTTVSISHTDSTTDPLHFHQN